MKRFIAVFLCLLCAAALMGCASSGPHTEIINSFAKAEGPFTETDHPAAKAEGPFTETDYPAAIMAEGILYLLSADAVSGEIDESAVIGYTTSYTDTFPDKNGETNFNRELNMPYARVTGGIVVFYENEWLFCSPKEN